MFIRYATFLGFLCSAVYLYTYWQAFGIDPFPYLDVSSLASYTLGAIAGSALTVLFGVAIGAFKKPEKETDEPPRFSWSDWPMLLVAAFLLFLGIGSPSILAGGLLVLIGLFASYRLSASTYLQFLHPSAQIRRLMIYAAMALPVMALIGAHANVWVNLSGPNKSIVIAVDGIEQEGIIGSTFVGVLGDVIVFATQDDQGRIKERFIVRRDAVDSLELGN